MSLLGGEHSIDVSARRRGERGKSTRAVTFDPTATTLVYLGAERLADTGLLVRRPGPPARIGIHRSFHLSGLRLRRPLTNAIDDKLRSDKAKTHRYNDRASGQAVGDCRAQKFQCRMWAIGKL